MKKIYLFLVFSLFVITGFTQQIDRNLVLLEITTGTWCSACPYAAHMADYLHDNGYPVAIIENHGPMGYGDPFANTNSVARNTYYGNTSYPTTQIDGDWTEGPWPINNSDYADLVNQRIAIQTSFNIDMATDISGNNYEITISVTKVAEYEGANLKVRFALTESHIQYNWMGESELNFVNHLMVPDANGTAVNFSSIGETVEVVLNFTFDDSWDVDNVELVAFIQDDDNKEVLNSAKIDHSLSAEVSADPDEICIGETSRLNATVTGGTGDYTYSWMSDPEGFVSDEQNPEIAPLETTIYMLEVDDGTQTTTAEVEVTVNDLPIIIMVDWPEQLCKHEEPPVQLNTLPSGGTYSGNNVTSDGVFSPEEAPVGWNIISYTYQNNDGCVNTESDSIFVDQCVGINNSFENDALLVVFPNPNAGSFKLNSGQTIMKVELINQIGQIVHSENFTSNYVTINTNIERGVYFVRATVSDKTGNTSIVYKKILVN